jgi:RNA processing factor Prp31
MVAGRAALAARVDAYNEDASGLCLIAMVLLYIIILSRLCFSCSLNSCARQTVARRDQQTLDKNAGTASDETTQSVAGAD